MRTFLLIFSYITFLVAPMCQASQPAYSYSVDDDNNASLYRVYQPASSLEYMIKSHAARAARYKQRFFLLVVTDTCSACKAMFREWQSTRFSKAIKGTYILSVNARQFDLSRIKLKVRAVPAFVALASDKRSSKIHYGFADTLKLASFLGN